MGEARRRRDAAVEVLPNGVCLGRNRPTPEGQQLGASLAKMADAGEPIARLEFPAMPPRCKSCAFTAGTVPNGCPETAIDAFGCIVESTPFMCHQRFDDDGNPQDLCTGWVFAMASPHARVFQKALDGKMPFEIPARSTEAQAYMDEERRKLRAKRRSDHGQAE